MAKALALEILDYANDLETLGVPKDQAERQARFFAEFTEQHLVTKQEKTELQKDIANLDIKMMAKFESIETRLNWLIALIGAIGAIMGIVNIIYAYLA